MTFAFAYLLIPTPELSASFLHAFTVPQALCLGLRITQRIYDLDASNSPITEGKRRCLLSYSTYDLCQCLACCAFQPLISDTLILHVCIPPSLNESLQEKKHSFFLQTRESLQCGSAHRKQQETSP